MKRCYEKEHWKHNFGEESYYHCGNGRTLSDGKRYCPNDGKLLGYVGYCAYINPPPEPEAKQITFDDLEE